MKNNYRTLLTVLLLTFTGITFANSNNRDIGNTSSNLLYTTTLTDTIKVPDMQCGECEDRIEGKLKKLNGVISVASNAKKKIVVVEHTESIKLLDIKRAIALLGYNAAEVKTTPSRRALLPKCCQPGGH